MHSPLNVKRNTDFYHMTGDLGKRYFTHYIYPRLTPVCLNRIRCTLRVPAASGTEINHQRIKGLFPTTVPELYMQLQNILSREVININFISR